MKYLIIELENGYIVKFPGSYSFSLSLPDYWNIFDQNGVLIARFLISEVSDGGLGYVK